ncbi:hypothetical protein LTR35_005300 [Friedmanniomyces endolithicus]|uniref:Uncharacterized protein n=1 Tax=Friedmanniomyces endolithicus TaxID=329885 RepID=A0AAN6FYV7_9PEZI|nr:hypothetical protein LTR35_005300 [Friedmanniomyces endolithicus]KAK0299498.1 hypothetical protein LTS00_001941 [Friedmanniomyces endolithicus]KAK0326991.1 hypothetical protein LTR82_001751 [Friedmanniomyces endolithicus]KAK1019173.1 hypothetical protein LTR54_000988 [Friedmanniomyces endolithicus]
MPTTRGISFSLLSQYDARALPESPLPILDQVTGRPQVRVEAKDERPGPRRQDEDGNVDRDGQSHITAVTIPVYPGSQFWMSYRCPRPPAPLPPSSISETATGNDNSFRFWYFKVFAAGRGGKDVCLVSWGVGEREQWSGKTVLALFEGRRRGDLEKRGFFFAAAGAPATYGGVEVAGGAEGEAMLEVRVYRSWARKRERGAVGVGGFQEAEFRSAGFETPRIGRLGDGERGRRHTYALRDAVDEPYVVFKYYAQGTIIAPSDSPLLGLAFSEAENVQESPAPASSPEGAVDEVPGLLRRRLPIQPRAPHESRTNNGHAKVPVPIMKRGHRKSPGDGVEDNTTSSMHGSTDGDKADGPPSDWGIKTPSPFKTDRVRFERASTPPSARAKNGSISVLRGVIANALRRRDGSGTSGIM